MNRMEFGFAPAWRGDSSRGTRPGAPKRRAGSLVVSAAVVLWSAAIGSLTARAADEAPAVSGREKIRAEAQQVRPTAETDLGRSFLDALAELPQMTQRTVYLNRKERKAIRPGLYLSLSDSAKAGYEEFDVTEDWYYRLYSSPIAYVRLLDLSAAAGFKLTDGSRIADFGFGNMGQVRALASLGAHVTGIEVPGMLDVMYGAREDRGTFKRAKSAGPGKDGEVQLVFGQYPSTYEIAHEVGLDYDLIMSKNTLKKGYIHPERATDPRNLVQLGTDDSTFVARVHEALKPGGLFVIYNLYGQQAAPDQPYKPWATGECPFDRDMMQRAGFEIVKWNVDDSTAARKMGLLLGWNANMDDATYAREFNAMVTIARKKP